MAVRICGLLLCAFLNVGAVRAASPADNAPNPFLGKPDYSVNHLYKTDPNRTVTLCEDGTPTVEIVVPKPSSPVVSFAAKELKWILESSFGAAVPIVHDRTGDRTSIMLGDGAWTKAWGVDVGRLPRDGFVIKAGGFGVPPGVVLIAGRDDPYTDPDKAITKGQWAQMYERATLNGVYDFAERFVGARFYFPGEAGTIVPRHRTLRIPAADVYEAPDFIVRTTTWYGGRWPNEQGDAQNAVTRPKNLIRYRLRGCTRAIPNNHGLSRLALIERFGKENPEFFALLPNGRRDNDRSRPHPGSLCYANRGFREELYEDAKAFLTGKSPEYRNVRHARWGGRAAWDQTGFQPGFFNIMPQDGLTANKWCHCPRCLPYLKQNRQGDLVWDYVVELANRLKKEKIPGYLTNMAYGVYKPVPKVPIPDNVLVMIALRGPWSVDDTKEMHSGDDLIRGWNQKLAPRKLWLWNYMNNYAGAVHPGVPPVSTKAIEAYYKHVAPDVLGAFVQTEHEWPLFHHLNLYVMMKLFWDTSADVDQLVKEHHNVMFGPAAGLMGEFFDRLETLWLTQAKPRTKYTDLGPVPVRKSEQEMWGKIYNEAIMKELDTLLKSAEKVAADDADALRRVRWFHKHYFGHMVRMRNAYADKRREISDLAVQLAAVPVGEKITLDGKPDEKAWNSAATVYLAPYNTDVPPQVKTAVRLLWSDDTLYVAFDCEEPKAAELLMPERQRDDKTLWQDASVELFLNPSGDRRNYFQFIVGASGAVADLKVSTDDEGVKKFDWSVNTGIKAATAVGKDRWSVELAIPLADLTDKPVAAGTEWIANIGRSRNVRNLGKETNLYTWSPFLQQGFHDLERFGRFVFVKKKGDDDQGRILNNGSFERLDEQGRPRGWLFDRQSGAIGTVELVDDDYREGCRSVRIELEKPGRLTSAQHFDALEPGATYLLTYFIRAEGLKRHPEFESGPVGAFVNIWSGRNFFFPRNWYTGTFGWTKEAFTFEAPANAREGKTYIRLGADNTVGVVWFDDVRIRKME